MERSRDSSFFFRGDVLYYINLIGRMVIGNLGDADAGAEKSITGCCAVGSAGGLGAPTKQP